MLAIADGTVSLALTYTTHSIVQTLTYKQSAKVIRSPDRLRIAHSKSKGAIGVKECLLAAHTFDYIVLRINPCLTTCKNLAMMVDNNLDNS